MGSEDALSWSNAFAKIAWRLHPPAAAEGFAERARSTELTEKDRIAALVALAYIGNKKSIESIVETASSSTGMTKAHSFWWLLNRMGDWKNFNVAGQLKEKEFTTQAI